MSTFTQYPRSAKWIIGLLVVLNLICLAALWLGHPARRRPPAPERRLIHNIRSNLQLNPEQTEALERLLSQHREELKTHREQTDRLVAQHRATMTAVPPDTTGVHQLAEQIGAQAVERENLIFRQFRELENLCGPEQKEKLRELFKRGIKRHRPPRRSNKGNN